MAFLLPSVGLRNASYFILFLSLGMNSHAAQSTSCFSNVAWSDENCLIGPFSLGTDIASKPFYQLCPKGQGRFEAPTSCDLYITCHEKSLTVNRCPSGSHFHPIDKTCVDSHLFECSYPLVKDPSIFLKPSGSNSSRRKRGGLHWSYGNADAFSYRITRAPKFCDDDEEGIFAHPESCEYFVQCLAGRKAVEQKCPPGTAFNSRLSICDWKSNVNCHFRFKRSEIIQSDSLIPLIKQVKPQEFHQIHKRSEQSSCPRDFIGPHPQFCDKFQICSNGRLFTQSCGKGTLFDPLKKVCAAANSVDCGARQRDFQTYDCQPGYKYSTLHPEDCRKFIECENEQIHIKSCPGKTIFNPEKSLCDFSFKTVCKSLISLEHDTDVNYRHRSNNRLNRDLSNYVCEFNYIAPLDGSCNRFIECENKRLFQKSCGPGTAYNPLLGQCDWPYNVRTQDAQYCQRYLQCDGRKFVSKQCPAENYYNADNGKCETADKVNCAGKVDDPGKKEYLQSK